jgi:endonuclease/exonuclease/phosphatase family metal-dependent hydrolase
VSEILLSIIASLSLVFAFLNLFLNGRVGVWELLNLIPTFLILIAWFLLSFISIYYNLFTALTFTICIILLFPYLDFTFVKRNKTKIDNKKIKFLDWNTLYFHPINHQAIADKINSFDADIIFIQELFNPDCEIVDGKMTPSINKITDITGYKDLNFVKHYFSPYSNIIISDDRAIISRFPLKQLKEVKINKFFGYLITSTEINGNEIILINVHMPFRKDNTFGYDEKLDVFKNLYDDIDNYKSENVIICGDFNACKSSYFIKNLFHQMNEAISQNNFGIHTSWPVKLPLWRLDFLFYSKNSKLNFTKAKFFSDKKFSDHKGIVGEFDIKE